MPLRPLKWVENGRPRARPISAVEWDRHRHYITQLHDDGKTRKEISWIMAREFDFKPSAHQYTSQFEKWNLKRYNTAIEPAQAATGGITTNTEQTPENSGLDDSSPDVSGLRPVHDRHRHVTNLISRPDAIQDKPASASNLPLSQQTPTQHNSFWDSSLLAAILDEPIPVFDSDPPAVLTPAIASASLSAGRALETAGQQCFVLEAETFSLIEKQAPKISPQVSGSRLINPSGMKLSDMSQDPHPDAKEISDTSGNGSSTADNPFSSTSDASSIVTVAGPSNAPRPNFSFSRVYDSNENPFSLRIEVDKISTPGLRDTGPNDSMHNLSESMSMLSIDEYSINPLITSQTGLYEIEQELPNDDVSDWRSIETRSLSPMQTDRISALVLSSENLNTPELLRERFSSRELRNVRRLIGKHKISDGDVRALLRSADFLRVSLLFEDALDMYLLAYLFLADTDSFLFNDVLLLQAITGCVESTRTFSGVRLVKQILGQASASYGSASFLKASGFPLPYLLGHIAMLENNNDLAARYFREAVQELGKFGFCDSAAVTSVLVHQLTTKLETLNARHDPNFGRLNADLDWLNIAIWELRNVDSPSTLPAAVKMLLTWCMSTMDDERLDATIEDVFLLSEEAFAVDRDGTSNSLHATLIICAHFWIMWGYENFPGSRSDISIQPSTELISQELEADLLAVFATVARMIMEQLNDTVPAVEDKPGESNLVTHMRNNALRLSNLEPVELEKSFIKTYFFVNTKVPNFGEGLHPRRYIRSIATQNMPEAIRRSKIGPSWMVGSKHRSNASIASTSTRCGAAPLQLLHRPSTPHSLRSSLSGFATMRALRDTVKRKASMRSGGSETSYIPSKAMRQRSMDSFRRLMGPSLTSVNRMSLDLANRLSLDEGDRISLR
jgi:hypothetical protein